jgi:polysaccharide pyruvyl transferase WcaK-like protein
VGVGVMNYFEWRGGPARKASNRAAYLKNMISLVEWLLEEGYAVRLLIGDRADEPYLETLLEMLRADHPELGPDRLVGDPARDLHQLMVQMSEVEVVIAPRYHNIITALRLAKPILALSYAAKAQEALAQFGVSPFSHSLDAMDLPRLKEQFSELYRRRGEIEALLRKRLTVIEAELTAQEREFVSAYLLRARPSGWRRSRARPHHGRAIP